MEINISERLKKLPPYLFVEIDNAKKKALQEGAITVSPAKQKPWGQTVACVRDPEGILIEIASKM